jgi:hypothetical protein
MKRVTFDEIEDVVPPSPGLYEIHTLSGVPLKVGIGVDVRERLLQHRASRESGLKLKDSGDWANPDDVASKKSIVAKHLYYDRSITNEYDLKTEWGRRQFLLNDCFILFEITDSKAAAEVRERELEGTGRYRYCGRVQCR